MITVVIPVHNQSNLTKDLLRNIANNVVQPKKIILIDNNSSENIDSVIKKYNNIQYIKQPKNYGVNHAWNLGIKLANTKFVSVLNNDIVINKYFFKKIIECFNLDNKIGIVCGKTIKIMKNIKLTDDSSVKIGTMKKREGWAYTIRKELANKIKPIPKRFKIYCGDDYLFFWTRKLGYKTIKILNNYLYHYGNKTTSKDFQRGSLRRYEKKLLRKYYNSLS